MQLCELHKSPREFPARVGFVNHYYPRTVNHYLLLLLAVTMLEETTTMHHLLYSVVVVVAGTVDVVAAALTWVIFDSHHRYQIDYVVSAVALMAM